MNDKRMTKEEAIGNLRYAIRWNDTPKKEALEMAIKALEQELCTDAISRQAVHRQINKWVASGESSKSLLSLHERVDTLEPVTPQSKMGRWIDDKCSICGKGIEDLIDSSEWYENETPNYCPFCGVRVVESEG